MFMRHRIRGDAEAYAEGKILELAGQTLVLTAKELGITIHRRNIVASQFKHQAAQ